MLLAALALVGGVSTPASAQGRCGELPPEVSTVASTDAMLQVRVTLRAADISLRDALDRLSLLTALPFAYSADIVPVDRRVCVRAANASLGRVLAAVLDGTGVQVLVVGGRIVLAPHAASAGRAAQPEARGIGVLQRVVVTGNAMEVPRRALALGVDVIEGERLRREGIGSLAEMLDLAVPGMWSWGQAPASVVAQYGSIRGASSFAGTYPKIYFDGVEVANPLLVTQLNPDVVERVEVIRGPQGSALYGSDAISGVINVITRQGGSTTGAPQLQLHSIAGATDSRFAASLVPTHEQRLSLRTGSSVGSAGLSLSYGQTGALFPASESRTVALAADARRVGSRMVLAGTARLFDKRAGAGSNPLFAGLSPPRDTGIVAAVPQSVRQYTVSGNATTAQGGTWRHTLLAGLDGYRLDHVSDAVGPFPTLLDSALRAARGSGDRMTLRVSSIALIDGDGNSPTTLTFGVEHSVLRQASTVSVQAAPALGQRYATVADVLSERWTHDTGILAQLGRSWSNTLFLSGGLRLERNDSFAGLNRYPLLPMIGVASVHHVRGADVKLRFAYGKGIRPPQTPARGAAQGYAAYAAGGPVPSALDPEEQAGYEAGVEVYVGRSLSVQLTRFDQRATGLIQNVAVALDTLLRGGSVERRVRYQLQNVGEIANAGWELHGTLTHGALSVSSALTAVDSRVTRVARGYLGDLRQGDRMLAVPARTASLSASYAGSGWSASAGAARAASWINYDRLAIAVAYAEHDDPAHRITGTTLREFWRAYDGQTHLRLSGRRELGRGLSMLLVGENLLGGQLGEPDNGSIRLGRTLTGGLQVAF